MCVLARDVTPHDDVTNLIHLHLSRVLAHEGRLEEAEEEGRRGLDLADTTDHFSQHAWARVYLSTILAHAGRDAEAAALAAAGLAIIEAKGDVTGLQGAQRLLEREGVAA